MVRARNLRIGPWPSWKRQGSGHPGKHAHIRKDRHCGLRGKTLMTISGRLLSACTLMAALLASPGSHAQTATQPPIKIGFGMALSGGLAGGGKAALLAYQIWAEDVNARGGLLGRKVELIHYDDQSNPATVPGIYTKLLDIDKVDLVISGYATVPTAASMPVIMQRKKLFLSLFALAANDQFEYDRYFQIQPNGPDAKREFSRGFFELAAGLNPKAHSVALVGADAEY